MMRLKKTNLREFCALRNLSSTCWCSGKTPEFVSKGFDPTSVELGFCKTGISRVESNSGLIGNSSVTIWFIWSKFSRSQEGKLAEFCKSTAILKLSVGFPGFKTDIRKIETLLLQNQRNEGN
uniref:Uncharacterized protein n=1 Tax=Cacopsylla melanoneura TaxID=428564 RepID=A0A8D9BRG6_9HEMI